MASLVKVRSLISSFSGAESIEEKFVLINNSLTRLFSGHLSDNPTLYARLPSVMVFMDP